MKAIPVLAAALAVAACNADSRTGMAEDLPFAVTPVASFDEPWAMTFLPDGRMLVTERRGRLLLVSADGADAARVAGVPEVAYGGQGGMGDVVLHPDFDSNGTIYLTYAEAGEGDVIGAALMRARLELDGNGAGLSGQEVIWRQEPKVTGGGHYSHRVAFSPDGYLFITSGDRQKMTPAQDREQALGKTIRLNDDGTAPPDNPFAGQGGVAAQVWTLGHRNMLGIAFDAEGRLWVHEMGPRHGDELNLVVATQNYGWPVVSYGNHYDGRQIPEHDERPEFAAPKLHWVPAVSPAGMIIYSGGLFPEWQGHVFLGGLTSHSLIRVELDGESAVEAESYDMGQRIREVEQGPDGAIWVLEDGRSGSGGRLLKLTPQE